MTPVIVNDASCLIDLRKGGLLNVICRLPYRLVVPLPVRASEVLDFSSNQWQHLDENGMITYDLNSDEIEQAFAHKGRRPALSANDCFCLVTALTHAGLLLTGDALLRKVAKENGLEVHGVLWVIDQLKNAKLCSNSLLINALHFWRCDATVFIPRTEIAKRLETLSALN